MICRGCEVREGSVVISKVSEVREAISLIVSSSEGG